MSGTTTSLNAASAVLAVVSTTTLTEAEADRLTTRIQLRLTTIADNTEAVLPLIEAARTGNAHEVLGFPSWTAYVADKFGGTLARLDKAERLPFVELLAGQGMSTRAIASVVGVGKSTVDRDLAAGVPDGTPDPEVADGDEVIEKNDTEVMVKNTISKNSTITGVDGKTYVRPSQAVPAEFGLLGHYLKAVHDLEKVLARLKRLHADERFLDDREELVQGWDCYDRLDAAESILMCITSDLADRQRCRDCKERLPIDSDLVLTCKKCSAPGGVR